MNLPWMLIYKCALSIQSSYALDVPWVLACLPALLVLVNVFAFILTLFNSSVCIPCMHPENYPAPMFFIQGIWALDIAKIETHLLPYNASHRPIPSLKNL